MVYTWTVKGLLYLYFLRLCMYFGDTWTLWACRKTLHLPMWLLVGLRNTYPSPIHITPKNNSYIARSKNVPGQESKNNSICLSLIYVCTRSGPASRKFVDHWVSASSGDFSSGKVASGPQTPCSSTICSWAFRCYHILTLGSMYGP